MQTQDKQKISEETLGTCGRMLCYSKGQYNWDNPRNLTVFNGNVCTTDGKVWYGDIDITEDEEKLNDLSKKLGETIYVLYEHDARFENEEKPMLDKAVAIFTNGKVDLGERTENFVREEGKLLERRVEAKPEPTPDPEWEEDETKYPEDQFIEIGQIPWKKLEEQQTGPSYYADDGLTEEEKKNQIPLNVFHRWADEAIKSKIELADGENVDAYIRSQDSDKIQETMKNYFINRMGYKEGSYRLISDLSWMAFSMPMEFFGSQKGPKWTKASTLYVKKKK